MPVYYVIEPRGRHVYEWSNWEERRNIIKKCDKKFLLNRMFVRVTLILKVQNKLIL